MPRLKILGFRIRPGLIVTILICICIVVFRYRFVSLLSILTMTATGSTNYCSAGLSFEAAAYTARVTDTGEEIFAGSHMVSEDPKGIELYQFGSKRFWIPKRNAKLVAYNLSELDHGIYSSSDAHIMPGDIVIDAGAYVGTFTLYALRQGAARVIAVEPAPLSIECLRRNFKDEIESGNVILCPKGVWDKDAILDMDLDPENSGANTFIGGSDAHEKQALPLATIDKIVSELGLPRVDFIKMDIEGAERKALAGACETIKRFHPRMAICVYHLADDPIVIPATVKKTEKAYQYTCEACGLYHAQIIPQVYFFYFPTPADSHQ
jgi:FkbM family methyltransferase